VTGHITAVESWYPIILPSPVAYPDGRWFDLAFELTTNEPKCPGLAADLNHDCIVNLPGFFRMPGCLNPAQKRVFSPTFAALPNFDAEEGALFLLQTAKR